DRGNGPEREGGGGKDDERLLVAGLQRGGRQLGKVSPLGHKDHGKGGHEGPAVLCLFPLHRPPLRRLPLAPIPANEEGGHDEEQKPGPDANRLPRQQAQERAGQDRDGALDAKGGRRPEQDREGPMPGREQQRRQGGLIRQLEQKDDGENRESEPQDVRHWGRSLSRVHADAQWSQSGKESTKTSRPRAKVRMLIRPGPSVPARRGS